MRRRRDAAGAVDAVEHDFESLGRNAVDVDAIEHALDVQRVRFGVFRRRDEFLHTYIRRSVLKIKLFESLRIGRRQGGGVGVEIFQAVPLNRIVRRRCDEGRVGSEVFHHHRHAGRGDDVEIDHLDAAGDERRDGRIAHPGPAGPRIAAENNAEMVAAWASASLSAKPQMPPPVAITTGGVSVPPTVPRKPDTPIINASMTFLLTPKAARKG